jgi:hypothetical protein
VASALKIRSNTKTSRHRRNTQFGACRASGLVEAAFGSVAQLRPLSGIESALQDQTGLFVEGRDRDGTGDFRSERRVLSDFRGWSSIELLFCKSAAPFDAERLRLRAWWHTGAADRFALSPMRGGYPAVRR